MWINVSIECIKTVKLLSKIHGINVGTTPSNLNLYIAHGYAGKFRGILDEVAIIAAVLSEDDVKDVMNTGFNEIATVTPNGKLATTWGNIKR